MYSVQWTMGDLVKALLSTSVHTCTSVTKCLCHRALQLPAAAVAAQPVTAYVVQCEKKRVFIRLLGSRWMHSCTSGSAGPGDIRLNFPGAVSGSLSGLPCRHAPWQQGIDIKHTCSAEEVCRQKCQQVQTPGGEAHVTPATAAHHLQVVISQ